MKKRLSVLFILPVLLLGTLPVMKVGAVAYRPAQEPEIRPAIFEEWLCLLNPNPEDTVAHITYFFPDGSTERQELPLKGNSRANVEVRSVVGEGRDVSLLVEGDAPIVAERPVHFNYRGAWSGGTWRWVTLPGLPPRGWPQAPRGKGMRRE